MSHAITRFFSKNKKTENCAKMFCLRISSDFTIFSKNEKNRKKLAKTSFLHFLSDFAIFQKPKKHWDSRNIFVYMFQAISQIFRTLLKPKVFCLHVSNDFPNFFQKFQNLKNYQFWDDSLWSRTGTLFCDGWLWCQTGTNPDGAPAWRNPSATYPPIPQTRIK